MNPDTRKKYPLVALAGLLSLISQNGFAHPVAGHDYSFFALLMHSMEHIHPLALLALPVIAAALCLWQNRRSN